MTTYSSVFGNALQTPVYNNFKSITFDENIQLAWSTQFQNGNNVVSTIMNFNPTTSGLTVTMPDATQTSVGAQFLSNNISSNDFTLLNFNNALIADILATSASIFYLADNTTQGGTWFHIPAGGGYSAVTSINAAGLDAITLANLNITGTPGLPITTTGTINFQFSGDLGALINFGTNTGFAVRIIGSPPGTPSWALRALIGTPNQIAITANPDGVAGDPIIGLATDITGITSLQVGNLSFAGNTISAFSGSDIILEPQSPGGKTETSLPLWMSESAPIRFYNAGSSHYMSLQGGELTSDVALKLPDSAPMDGQVLYYITAGELGWLTVAGVPGSSTLDAIPRFTNTSGQLGDTGIICDNFNNLTGVNSIIAQNIRIGISGANIISTTAGSLTLSPAGGGNVVSSSILIVSSGNSLRLNNASNDGYGGFSATTTASSAANTWNIPLADGVARSLMQTDGGFNLSFTGITTDYIGKGFGIFNGTAGIGAITPLDSVNIASINKTGTGVYTVVVTNAFASSNYGLNGIVNGAGYIGNLTISNSTTFAFTTYSSTGMATDFSYVTFELFGKQ